MLAKSVTTLEGKPCVDLNLASSADGGEYSTDVFGEISSCILENGLRSLPGERALGVARYGKIRMIEQIVGFRPNCDFLAFRHLEALLKRQIKL